MARMESGKPSRPKDQGKPTSKAPVAKAQASQNSKPSKLTDMKAARKKVR